MASQEWIEKLDASRGIPRKVNEQYLPAYQAFWSWAGDVGQAWGGIPELWLDCCE